MSQGSNTSPMTNEQHETIVDSTIELVAKGLKRQPLFFDNAQMLTNNWGNLEFDFAAALFRHSLIDPNFELVDQMELRVPKKYDHANQLSFILRPENCVANKIHQEITDQNFSDVSHRLNAGEKYLLKIVEATRDTNYLACLALLESQVSLFVGPQGLSLIMQLKRNLFAKSRKYLALDRFKKLLKSNDQPMIPCAGITNTKEEIIYLDLQPSFQTIKKGTRLICLMQLNL